MPHWKLLLILLVSLCCVIAVLLLPPIAQDLNYHLFADQQAWLGLPNFWNVISNLPFILVGLIGLARLPLSVDAKLLPGYWYWTELQGQGDLRPYALVQFLPLILIPLMLLLFGTQQLRACNLWLTLALYLLAKAAEHFDGEIYTQLGMLSGHSLKHLIAAITILFAVLAFPRAVQTTEKHDA